MGFHIVCKQCLQTIWNPIMCALAECTIFVYLELAWIWFTRTETCCQLCINWLYMCF